MLKKEQYQKIQEYKEIGLTKSKVSEKLGLSYKTICNWWDKDEEYLNDMLKDYLFLLDTYRQYLIEILNISPQINNTLLYRRIKKDFSDFYVPESTFYRYIKRLEMKQD